jgi:hypothetical protein
MAPFQAPRRGTAEASGFSSASEVWGHGGGWQAGRRTACYGLAADQSTGSISNQFVSIAWPRAIDGREL